MERTCETCGQPLLAERLKARPGATHCVKCKELNDEEKTIGVMLWDHKTAPRIELSTSSSQGAVRSILRHSRRGVHAQLPLVSKGKAERAFATSDAPASPGAEFDSVRAYVRGEASSVPRDHADLTDVRNIIPSRCHPTRPSISPSGLCLECALNWYAKRRIKP